MMLIWLTSIGLHYLDPSWTMASLEDAFWLQLAGFIMIVLGNLLYSDVITMPSIWDIREDFDSGKIKYSQLSSNDESNDVEI